MRLEFLALLYKALLETRFPKTSTSGGICKKTGGQSSCTTLISNNNYDDDNEKINNKIAYYNKLPKMKSHDSTQKKREKKDEVT